MLKVVSWRLVGGHYFRGMYYAGFNQAMLSDGTVRTYPEKTSLRSELRKEGVDCSMIDDWVRTGEGATFTLQ